MTYTVEVDCVVRRGFPVRVIASIAPAERDVGLPNDYIDDICILTRTGRPTDWLKLTDKEVDEIEQQVWDHAAAARRRDREDYYANRY